MAFNISLLALSQKGSFASKFSGIMLFTANSTSSSVLISLNIFHFKLLLSFG